MWSMRSSVKGPQVRVTSIGTSITRYNGYVLDDQQRCVERPIYTCYGQ